jgi:hypothetical protein
MKILAFMQNQWFKNPEKVRAQYERYPDMRNDLIARYLFMGCLSGRRLQAALGEALCDQIVWEEASPEIGGNSASKFPADAKHIAGAIIKHNPDVVFAFGKIASDGVLSAFAEIESHPTPINFRLITGPHPAARNDPMPRLREMAQLVG